MGVRIAFNAYRFIVEHLLVGNAFPYDYYQRSKLFFGVIYSFVVVHTVRGSKLDASTGPFVRNGIVKTN